MKSYDNTEGAVGNGLWAMGCEQRAMGGSEDKNDPAPGLERFPLGSNQA
jgi:hypothetical protein